MMPMMLLLSQAKSFKTQELTLLCLQEMQRRYLFKRYNKVSLKMVVQKARLYKETGQEWHLENSDWSAAKVLNSSEDELRAKIVEDAASVPSHLRTGPVLSS